MKKKAKKKTKNSKTTRDEEKEKTSPQGGERSEEKCKFDVEKLGRMSALAIIIGISSCETQRLFFFAFLAWAEMIQRVKNKTSLFPALKFHATENGETRALRGGIGFQVLSSRDRIMITLTEAHRCMMIVDFYLLEWILGNWSGWTWASWRAIWRPSRSKQLRPAQSIHWTCGRVTVSSRSASKTCILIKYFTISSQKKKT